MGKVRGCEDKRIKGNTGAAELLFRTRSFPTADYRCENDSQEIPLVGENFLER